MLRLTALLLLLANAGYYAWSQGLLAAWGLEPARQAEPQRLHQQIKPEAVRIVPAAEVRGIEATAGVLGKPPECLQAGLFEDAQIAGVRKALDSWPAGSWSLDAAVEPARWILYMGKYATAENVSRKKAELRQLGVSFEALSNPALEPGLSLGGFGTQAAATQQMEALAQRGVHTAKVVQERAEQRGQLLKLAALDDSLRPRLDELKPALNGKTLRPCR
jgi:hypothetical protein